MTGCRDPHQHRHHAQPERARAVPRATTGAPTLAHGRFGNREKSGARFSLNASRPSCASSLM